MVHAQDLTKYGIVALAAIAILGWIREPERHGSTDTAPVEDSAARPRATFSPPPDDQFSLQPEAGVPADYASRLPGEVTPAAASRSRSRPPVRPHVRSDSDHSARRPAIATRSSEIATGNGRGDDGDEPRQPHEARDESTAILNSPVKTREDGQHRTARSQAPRDEADHSRTQPQVRTKQRSTARSAAIIAGAAAAGAAIGGLAGGGKGAAIGAITGGGGGYVYDRMTRRTRTSAPAGGSHSGQDTDQSGDVRDDRGPSLARRFGTPSFN